MRVYAITIGVYAITTGVYAITKGVYAITTGVYAITTGVYAITMGVYAITIGVYADVMGVYAISDKERVGSVQRPVSALMVGRDLPSGMCQLVFKDYPSSVFSQTRSCFQREGKSGWIGFRGMHKLQICAGRWKEGF